MKPYQNSYAFIDSQNLNLSIRDQGWKLDYKKFRIYLKDKHKVNKAILFLGYIKENKKMYSSLMDKGYEIVFKPTTRDKNNVVKGNCDAELVLQCMIEYNNFDKAIIVTGDGDFYCLIKYLLAKDKLLKVGIPNKKKYSILLREFKSHFFYFEDLKSKLEHKKREA